MVMTPAGDTCCCDPITTKQLTEPQEALTDAGHAIKVMHCQNTKELKRTPAQFVRHGSTIFLLARQRKPGTSHRR